MRSFTRARVALLRKLGISLPSFLRKVRSFPIFRPSTFYSVTPVFTKEVKHITSSPSILKKIAHQREPTNMKERADKLDGRWKMELTYVIAQVFEEVDNDDDDDLDDPDEFEDDGDGAGEGQIFPYFSI